MWKSQLSVTKFLSKWEHVRMIPWWIHAVDSARPRGQSHRFPRLTLNAFNTVVGNRGPWPVKRHMEWKHIPPAAFCLGHDRPLKAGVLSSKTLKHSWSFEGKWLYCRKTLSGGHGTSSRSLPTRLPIARHPHSPEKANPGETSQGPRV